MKLSCARFGAFVLAVAFMMTMCLKERVYSQTFPNSQEGADTDSSEQPSRYRAEERSGIFLSGAVYASTFPSLQEAYDSLPPSGGMIVLPCGDIRLRNTLRMRTHPVILIGCGGSIGFKKSGRGGTRIIWVGGPGIAIDLGDQVDPTTGLALGATRGSILRDFNLANAGRGSIGIRINSQEPKLINVYVFRGELRDPFSEAGVVVGDLEQVNDFLCRDCYLRWEKLGLSLLFVSESTIDHSRILQNEVNIRIGDAGHTAGNVNLLNGTNFSPEDIGHTGLQVIRAPRRLVISSSYCENEGTGLCIDASTIVGNDLQNLVIRDNYFARANVGASHAVVIDSAGATLTVTGNTFFGYAQAGVQVASPVDAFVAGNSLQAGTPSVLSSNIETTAIRSDNVSLSNRAAVEEHVKQ